MVGSTSRLMNFGQVMTKLSQLTARPSFEIQFAALQNRLVRDLNRKNQEYNDIDKTIEPQLASERRERSKLNTQKEALDSYIEKGSRNFNKLTEILGMFDNLYTLGLAAGPTAAEDFDFERNRLDGALRTLQSNPEFSSGLKDLVATVKGARRPSGIENYASFATPADRLNAVGAYASQGTDSIGVNRTLSFGSAERFALLREQMHQDLDVAKASLKTVTEKITELDKKIDFKVSQAKLTVLKEIQAMQKKNESYLTTLSINFEFNQGNLEILSTSFNINQEPEAGSVLNLFI